MKKLYVTVLMAIIASLSVAQFNNDPATNLQITNLTGEQVLPKIALAPNGDYYIGFFSQEEGNYNVRLQRLDSKGNLLWEENGLLISDNPSMSWITDWDMTVDQENHAIITFQDIRNAGNNNIYAYRISPEGDFVWGTDGLELSNNSNFDASPKVIVTQSNNSIIAWASMASTAKIVMQKIAPDGTLLFGDTGIDLISATANLSWPQLLPVGTDDFIMKYYEDTGPGWAPTRHLFAQRYDSNGDAVWENPAAIQTAGTITAWTQILPIISDGNEGFFITWHDNQLSGTISSSWIQHVDSEGNTSFTQNGLLLSNRNDYNQFNPKFAPDENRDNVYVYWEEVTGDQNQGGIYGQKVTSSGELLWGEGGKKIIEVSSQEVLISNVLPYDNKAFLIYKTTTGTNHTFYAQYLDENGGNLWDPSSLAFASAESSKGRIATAPFNDQYWVFAFEDERNGNPDIYTQNLYPDGYLGLMSTVEGTISTENQIVAPDEVVLTIDDITMNPQPDGTYQTTLLPGTYTFSANHPFLDEIVNTDVSLTGGENTTIDFSMMLSRRDIQFTLEDTEGNLISHASVTISGPEDDYTGTTTETPLEFTGVPYGSYTASAVWGAAMLNTETIIDENTSEIVITDTEGVFSQNGFVSGVVTIEGDMANVAEVTLSSGNTSISPDDHGNYTIALSPGMHNITVNHPFTTNSQINEVAVLPGITSTNWDITLDMLRGDLNCYVQNQDGQIILNMDVEVTGPEGEYSFNTGTSNEPHILTQVPYGEYTMTIPEIEGDNFVTAVLDENNQDIIITLHTVNTNLPVENETFVVYPNPLNSSDNLLVRSRHSGTYNLKVVSMNGSVINKTMSLTIEKGENIIGWETLSDGRKLETGMYILVLQNNDHQIRLPLMIIE